METAIMQEITTLITEDKTESLQDLQVEIALTQQQGLITEIEVALQLQEEGFQVLPQLQLEEATLHQAGQSLEEVQQLLILL